LLAVLGVLLVVAFVIPLIADFLHPKVAPPAPPESGMTLPLGAVVFVWLLNVVTEVMRWLVAHAAVAGFLLLAWLINGLYNQIAELKEAVGEVKETLEELKEAVGEGNEMVEELKDTMDFDEEP
jgi:hypothetical protein